MRKGYRQQKRERSAGVLFEPFHALLASCNRRSENVIVKAGIIPELELSDIEMKAFFLTLWKVPTIPRLKDTPAPRAE
jgi:hypothetical protein